MNVLYKIGIAIGLAFSLWACSDDAGEGDPVRPEQPDRVMEMPVEVSLRIKGDELRTKAGDDHKLPNGDVGYPTDDVREVFVNRVWLNVYKRPITPKGEPYGNDEDRFYLDPANSGVVLTCEETGGPYEVPSYIARGRISIQNGQEYRITAVAYSENKYAGLTSYDGMTQNERTWFDRIPSDGRFDHVLLKLNGGEGVEVETETEKELKQYPTPEFFFGTIVCPNESDPAQMDTLFTFDRMEALSANSKGTLTGWLYRGVAGIEVNLGDVGKDVERVELLAESLNTSVHAMYYDSFLTPGDKLPYPDPTYKHPDYPKRFLLGAGVPERTETYDSVHVRYANVLPVCTPLWLRIIKSTETTSGGTDGGDTDANQGTTPGAQASGAEGEGAKRDTVYYRIRIKTDSIIPPRVVTRTIPGDAGEGTGIIDEDPVFPEPDPKPDPDPDKPADPYKICFQRNHYYRIGGNYDKMSSLNYVFQVLINPFWDGTVNLTLEKGL